MELIKFRGIAEKTNEFVYGYVRMLPNGDVVIYTEDNKRVKVIPESVKQLIGYDKNDKEVYRGDIMLLEDHRCKFPYNMFIADTRPYGFKYQCSVGFRVSLEKHEKVCNG